MALESYFFAAERSFGVVDASWPTRGSAQISDSTASKLVTRATNAIIPAMFNDGEILGKQS
jgi:hypothetical protein